MSKPTAKMSKAASKEAGHDHLFRKKFGIEATPATADVMRCKLCGSFLMFFRKDVWFCERMLCGPIIPEQELILRLVEQAGFRTKGEAGGFLDEVKITAKVI